MSLLENLRHRVQQNALEIASNTTIEIEAYKRGKSSLQPESEKLTKEMVSLRKKTLKEWKKAVAMATDPEQPSYTELVELYQSMKLDAHLMSAISSRVLRIQQSKFKLTNKAGDEVEELSSFFEDDWFTDWIEHVLMTQYTGISLIELWYTNAEGALTSISEIPKTNVDFRKKLILKNIGDTTGVVYNEGQLATYYMEIGKADELGLFAEIAPLILAKKLALGSWLDFIEKFGVPPRWVTTQRQDTTRREELFDMMMAMISNQVAVLVGDEKIEIADTPNTDAFKVFNELIERINSEISKRILGATGTSDEKSFVGAAKVHQDVANDRHERDKVIVKNLINKSLIPKLIKISSYYAPLANVTFEWDATEEMSKNELIDSVASLSSNFEFDTEELARVTGLPIIGMKSTPQNITKPAGGEDGKKH